MRYDEGAGLLLREHAVLSTVSQQNLALKTTIQLRTPQKPKLPLAHGHCKNVTLQLVLTKSRNESNALKPRSYILSLMI